MATQTLDAFASIPTTKQVFTAQALNGSADARTATILFGAHRPTRARFDWILDRTAATDVKVNAFVSPNGGTSWFPVCSRDIDGAGTGTVSEYTDNKAVSGDDEASLEYTCGGATGIRFVISGTSGGASDLVDGFVSLY